MLNTQIIWYAKGHYGSSDDHWEDLRKVIQKWALLPEDCPISRYEIIDQVLRVWFRCNPDPKLIMEIFLVFMGNNYQNYTNLDSEDYCLSRLLGGILASQVSQCPELPEKWEGFKLRDEKRKSEQEERLLGETQCRKSQS